MNVCRSPHPMGTSGYYLLVTHYDIVSPVPRLGDPHGAGALHHDFRCSTSNGSCRRTSCGESSPSCSSRTGTSPCRRKGSPRTLLEAIRVIHKQIVRHRVQGARARRSPSATRMGLGLGSEPVTISLASQRLGD